MTTYARRTAALLALSLPLFALPALAGQVSDTTSDETVVTSTTATQPPAAPATTTTVEQVPGDTPGSTITKETTINQKPVTTTTTTVEKTHTSSDGTVTTSEDTTVSPPQPGPGIITTSTATHPLPYPPGTHLVNFMDFDLNHDGVLSTREAGDMLFKLFDQDGNEVIDNKEYEKRSVLTFVPMEKETVVRYDFDNTGVPDKVEHTYQSYLERTQLSRFAHNPNGLSPHDFTGRSFNEMDVNHDGVIDLKEWRGAYDATIDKQNRLAAELNK